MNHIFMIEGPSGVGKTTLVNELAKRYGLKVVQSYTTRPKRTPDETGHTFVSDDEFDKLENLVAYTEFAGHRYGVPQSMIEENDLYVIDPAGVRFFRSHYTGSKTPIVIYLHKNEKDLMKQMQQRGDSDYEIAKRLSHDVIAFFGASAEADYFLELKGSVDKCVKSIKAVIDEVCSKEVNS